jgi:putative membrane protein
MQDAGRAHVRWLPGLLALAFAVPASAQDTTMVAGMEQDQLFSDAEIAAVVNAASQDEIQQSRLALEQTQDEQVREFAQLMVTEHTQLQQEMEQLLQQKGLVPEDNPFSTALTRNTEGRIEGLRSFAGADFDREYMLQQIAAHGMMLQTLESTLIPTARDSELRQLLDTRLRPTIERHLELAKERLRGLSEATEPVEGTPRG